MHYELPGHGGDNIFHQCPREAEPAMVVKPASSGQCTFAQDGRGISHTHLLQNIEGRLMHALDIPIGEGLVGTTLK
jgi:hypothetical protein